MVGVVLCCDCVVISWLWGRISKLAISLSWLASSELLFLPSLPQPTSSLHRGTIFLVLLGPPQGKRFSDHDPEILKNMFALLPVKFTGQNALFVLNPLHGLINLSFGQKCYIRINYLSQKTFITLHVCKVISKPNDNLLFLST